MKILVAIDSFKGSLSSMQAGQAVATGIKRVFPTALIDVRPIADGGEGSVSALVSGMGGNMQSIQVMGALGDDVEAEYGIILENSLAIIEMSAAAGLTLVPNEKRNPLYTTTYGVGEMILDALKKGCRSFIIGIGSSATNDGGFGMMQALGYDFLDENNHLIPLCGKGLEKLHTIQKRQEIPELNECTFHIACDVSNPLCGPTGCSTIYGPQKGANSEIISQMDKWLANYAELVHTINPNANQNTPGAGAAGGLGFAFLAFLNGQLKNGIQLILEETKLEDYIKQADLIVTGEGRLDSQTAMGKAPIGIAQIAKKYGKPVIAFSGSVTQDANVLNSLGIDAFFPILHEICSLEEAMDKKKAYKNLADTSEQVFRVIQIMK